MRHKRTSRKEDGGNSMTRICHPTPSSGIRLFIWVLRRYPNVFIVVALICCVVSLVVGPELQNGKTISELDFHMAKQTTTARTASSSRTSLAHASIVILFQGRSGSSLLSHILWNTYLFDTFCFETPNLRSQGGYRFNLSQRLHRYRQCVQPPLLENEASLGRTFKMQNKNSSFITTAGMKVKLRALFNESSDVLGLAIPSVRRTFDSLYWHYHERTAASTLHTIVFLLRSNPLHGAISRLRLSCDGNCREGRLFKDVGNNVKMQKCLHDCRHSLYVRPCSLLRGLYARVREDALLLRVRQALLQDKSNGLTIKTVFYSDLLSQPMGVANDILSSWILPRSPSLSMSSLPVSLSPSSATSSSSPAWNWTTLRRAVSQTTARRSKVTSPNLRSVLRNYDEIQQVLERTPFEGYLKHAHTQSSSSSSSNNNNNNYSHSSSPRTQPSPARVSMRIRDMTRKTQIALQWVTTLILSSSSSAPHTNSTSANSDSDIGIKNASHHEVRLRMFFQHCISLTKKS